MIVIYGLLVLSFIVCIHELGHYASARICGVRVESFSLGMGPVLLHKQGKMTDWRLSLLPIGGYCGLKGEQDFRNAYEAGLSHVQADSDSMYGVKPLARAFIGFSGPLANFLLAVISMTVVAMTGYTYYASSTKITLANEVYPEMHSAAADAGLLTGDTVLTVSGESVADFSELFSAIASRPDEDIRITVDRAGEVLSFTVHTDMDTSTGAGKIGVVSDPDSVTAREAKRYAFFPAIAHGTAETCNMLYMTVKSIALLFRGVKVTEAVSGPARITTMLGGTVKNGFSAGWRTGLSSLLEFVALISVSLFFMNLLPIPILDGSLVLFSLIEAVFHIEISPKIKNNVQYIGLVFIAALFLIALTSDARYFYGAFHGNH
ncbi:MAG: site-2 protease family protein [Treponema sp.]|nr:site-2 protease family protein [Treponema sp.]